MTTWLAGTEGGLWSIQTASAAYLLDLDRRTLTRVPGESVAPGWAVASTLRRDGEEVPLLGLVRPVTVGEGMSVMIDVRGDGVPTVRHSTAVRSITPAGSLEPGVDADEPSRSSGAASIVDLGTVHVVRGDDRHDDVPVPEWASIGLIPGTLDLRILDQAHVWVTCESTVLSIRGMATAHLRAVVTMLMERAGELALRAILDAVLDVVVSDLMGEVSAERLAWEVTGGRSIAETPAAYLEATALMRALRRELAARERDDGEGTCHGEGSEPSSGGACR